MTEPAPSAGGRRWSFLLQPKWIAGHLLVLFVAVVFVLLGFWQLHRNDQKHAKNAAAKAKYAAPAPALGPPGTEPPVSARAEATGHYDAGGEALLRNRVHDGEGGYDVLTPLVLGDGTAVVVDRGWAPRNLVEGGSGAVDRKPAVLDPPSGTVTVRGPVGESRPLQPEDTVAEQAGRTTLPGSISTGCRRTPRITARGVHQRAVPGPRARERPARAAGPAAVGRRQPPAVRLPMVRVRADPARGLAHRPLPGVPPATGTHAAVRCRLRASGEPRPAAAILARSGRRRRMQMPYAEGRTYYDADSHLMELGDWLTQYADPDVASGSARCTSVVRVPSPTKRSALPSTGAATPTRPPARGQRDEGERLERARCVRSRERSRALDLLGFDSQLVFSTFAGTQFIAGDVELLYGGPRAHNRAMVEFCSGDARLIPVGFVALDDPELARQATEEAIAMGCGAILLPSVPPRDKSPAHPDYWPVWAALKTRVCRSCCMSVAAAARCGPRSTRTGSPPSRTSSVGARTSARRTTWRCTIRPRSSSHASRSTGSSNSSPASGAAASSRARSGSSTLLQRLDLAQATFQKTEPALRLPLKPSEYLRRQVKFTPFPTEPVGWLIEQAGPELFCFSSDYPHPEGGRDPLGRFEASLAGIDEDAKERFYTTNYAEMMGPVLASRV